MSRALAKAVGAFERRWKAHWIWHPELAEASNVYVAARRRFRLRPGVKEARIALTSANGYRLYVNGRFVGQGPNPSDEHWLFYDEYDIAAYLVPGENVIAIEAHAYGPGWKGNQGGRYTRSGLLAEARLVLEDGRRRELRSNASWRMARLEGYDASAPQINPQRAFGEWYDARREIAGWKLPGFDDRGWAEAADLGRPPQEPWTYLIPRMIPFLAERRVFARRVSVEGAEVRNPEALLSEGPGWAEIALEEGEKVRLKLDFGDQVIGYPFLGILDAPEGTEIEISYSEGDTWICNWDRYICRQGNQNWRHFSYRGFRYLYLDLTGPGGVLKLKQVGQMLTTYPFSHTGSFRCSDPMLSRIWEVAAHTVELNAQDHYTDGTFRELILWTGDFRIEGLVGAYALGDTRLLRKALYQIAFIQREDGALPAMGPFANNFIVAGYAAFWIICLCEYHSLTGDLETVRALYPTLEKALAWFESHENEDGFLVIPEGEQQWWGFVDHEQVEQREAGMEVAGLQCQYFGALQSASLLCLALHGQARAEALREKSRRLSAQINQHLWSEERGLFADNRWRGKLSDNFTVQTQAMALRFLVAEEERAERLLAAVLDSDLLPPSTGTYSNFFLVGGLLAHGRYREAYEFIRDYWGEMIARGATTFWEKFDPRSPFGELPTGIWSHCHGWAGGPAYFLSTNLLGVESVLPGFNSVIIAPEPGGLRWAGGAVPTAHGEVRVEWRMEPEGFRIKLALPCPKGGQLLFPVGERPWRQVRCGDSVIWGEDAAAPPEGIAVEVGSGGMLHALLDAPGEWEFVARM